jgi:hypothetical protein
MQVRSYVIPAQAGIQGWGGVLRMPSPATWMPAFAGMTIIHPGRMPSRLPVHSHPASTVVPGPVRPHSSARFQHAHTSKFTHSIS